MEKNDGKISISSCLKENLLPVETLYGLTIDLSNNNLTD